MPTKPDLYNHDFYAWTQQQAALLRDEKTQALDYANLAEEIESLGRSDKRELGNRLHILVMHLLKWCYQPQGHAESHSWEDTIWHQRTQIMLLLEESPSLHREIPARLARHYLLARRDAARETRLPLATFPEMCPWTVEQILHEDFWPEG
jgi:Domain of unknown function DUF29